MELPSASSSIQEQSADSAEEDETDDEGWQIKMTRGPAVVGVLGCEGAADGASHQDSAEEMQRRIEGNAASVVQPVGMPEEANFAAPLWREGSIPQAAELRAGREREAAADEAAEQGLPTAGERQHTSPEKGHRSAAGAATAPEQASVATCETKRNRDRDHGG